MLWMFDRNFKTSKALKTFQSLLLMLSLFKVFLIFHQIKCTQWSEVVVYRVRSEKFREVLSSLFLFFPPLCAAYQNSIQNFTSFIRKEHLSSENRFKIPYFLCRLYQATLPQFWTSITLLQWKNKREFFHSKVIILYKNVLPTFIVQFFHNLSILNFHVWIRLRWLVFSNIFANMKKVKNEIYADWILGEAFSSFKMATPNCSILLNWM